jgi:hypothetical protein
MVKKYLNAYMPTKKNEICSKIVMRGPYRFISEKTDSAVRRYLMPAKM